MGVSILNNPGIAGASFIISYDLSVLTLESATADDLFRVGTYSTSMDSGVVQWYHTENVTNDGALFTLHFQVSPAAQPGDYSVSIGLKDHIPANLSDQDAEIVTAQFAAGTLTVNIGIPGDVTGDGVVAINDVVKTARAVAGSLTLTAEEAALADVTGDSVVAINDVVKLARFVAGNVATLENAGVFLMEAGEPAVIAVASIHAAPGETVQIPVSITSNPGIAGAQLDIVFDEDVLTLKDIVKGDVLSVGSFNPDVSGKNVQWYYDQADVTQTGVLFTLEFEVSLTAQTEEGFAVKVKLGNDLAANFSNYDFNVVGVNFTDGIVTVQTSDPTPEAQFTIADVPTANDGTSITSADPETISAVIIPVRYSGLGGQNAKVTAAFYDANGRFAGFGIETVAIRNGVNPIEIPVHRYAGKLKKLKVLILDASSLPLTSINSYDLP